MAIEPARDPEPAWEQYKKEPTAEEAAAWAASFPDPAYFGCTYHRWWIYQRCILNEIAREFGPAFFNEGYYDFEDPHILAKKVRELIQKAWQYDELCK